METCSRNILAEFSLFSRDFNGDRPLPQQIAVLRLRSKKLHCSDQGRRTAQTSFEVMPHDADPSGRMNCKSKISRIAPDSFPSALIRSQGLKRSSDFASHSDIFPIFLYPGLRLSLPRKPEERVLVCHSRFSLIHFNTVILCDPTLRL